MPFDLKADEWHSIFVVTGEEDRVKERIKYRLQDDFTVVVPKRKLRLRKGGIWRTETRVLFPGYVLINGGINSDIYYLLKDIPNVLRLLRTGSSIASIDSQEMAVLSRLICNSEEIGLSSVLMENGRVRVVDGPLFSLEGIILSIDSRKQRAKVKLSFLGEERTVDLGISILTPA
ncbi:MAG TPA: antiterminator LoaP [Clostridia bacterium]|nr:antiterminator LoaP [Clostridia bacterium]